MTCITEVNQLFVAFGLNFVRDDHLYRLTDQSFTPRDEVRDIVDNDVLDVGHPIEGLGNCRSIDVDLNGGSAARQEYPPGTLGEFR